MYYAKGKQNFLKCWSYTLILMKQKWATVKISKLQWINTDNSHIMDCKAHSKQTDNRFVSILIVPSDMNLFNEKNLKDNCYTFITGHRSYQNEQYNVTESLSSTLLYLANAKKTFPHKRRPISLTFRIAASFCWRTEETFSLLFSSWRWKWTK